MPRRSKEGGGRMLLLQQKQLPLAQQPTARPPLPGRGRGRPTGSGGPETHPRLVELGGWGGGRRRPDRADPPRRQRMHRTVCRRPNAAAREEHEASRLAQQSRCGRARPSWQRPVRCAARQPSTLTRKQVCFGNDGDGCTLCAPGTHHHHDRRLAPTRPRPPTSPPAGLRRVRPYFYAFNCFCKRRWVGRSLVEVFAEEFAFEEPAFYVGAGRMRSSCHQSVATGLVCVIITH